MIVKDFLDPTLNQEILNYIVDNEAEFIVSKLSRKSYENSKDGIKSLTIFDIGKYKKVFEDKIKDLLPTIFDRLNIYPFTPAKIETEFGAYGDGAFFGHHVDTVTKAGAESYRIISAIYYLHSTPRKFTGGELVLHPLPIGVENDNSMHVQHENNILVIFHSYVPHEVLPVVAPSLPFKDWRFAVNCMVHKE
jgi:SM-20-related protein